MTHHAPQRGYTLLELIVSLGIFSVVMLVVTGAYLTLIALDRQARANNQLSTSLSFAIESMARSIRTGTEYDPGIAYAACGQGGSRSISFTDSQSQEISYILKGDNTIGQCTGSTCTDSNAAPLTDPRISITSLCFYVRGVGTGDDRQPQVTFTVSGTMRTDSGDVSEFSVQSSATQRVIDL